MISVPFTIVVLLVFLKSLHESGHLNLSYYLELQRAGLVDVYLAGASR
jgi:hypothetical protein